MTAVFEESILENAKPAHPRIWLLILLFCVGLIYMPGLDGPFLFDDFTNLVAPLGDWLQGTIGWQEIVFGNGSGPLGRVVSMASFLFNAAVGGLDPWSYKLVNLGIHLANGVLIYFLTARLLAQKSGLESQVAWLPLLIAALWLAHPIQVSTVLYIVQRMAQLSTLFTLLALLFYVVGRQRVEDGQTHAGLTWLFAGVPAATILAVLSKENGALVPLLCAVLELGFFRPAPSTARPRIVKAFFAAFLLAPGLLVAGWIALHPQGLLAGYADRTFTLSQRLLSEPRVVMDYLGALLVPQGPALGIYTDDFPVSRSLLDPWTTLPSILGLVVLAVLAYLVRKRHPLIFTGVAFFLAGHLMESTAFPLEIYFEHRNYLPSVGFFMALAGVGAWITRIAAGRGADLRQMQNRMGVGAGVLVLLYGLATFARAGIWSSFALIAMQGAAQHPDSLRAQMDYANVLQKAGRSDETQRILDRLLTSDNPTARHAAAVNTVTLECMTHGVASPESIERIDRIAGDDLRTFDMMVLGNLAEFLASRECGGLSGEVLANTIVGIVDASSQPATLVQLWRSRFNAAKLLVRAGKLAQGRRQLELAWETGAADPAVGAFLAQVQLAQGDSEAARITLDSVHRKLKWWDHRGLSIVEAMEARVRATGKSSNAPAAGDQTGSPT